MNGGKNMSRAVGMAGKNGEQAHSLLNKATAGKHSRWTLRLAQASRNNQPMAWLRSKNTTAADDVLPLAVQVSGGNAVVLAAMKAGADLPTVLPHLTPLPVTVPTHSLNLKNPI